MRREKSESPGATKPTGDFQNKTINLEGSLVASSLSEVSGVVEGGVVRLACEYAGIEDWTQAQHAVDHDLRAGLSALLSQFGGVDPTIIYDSLADALRVWDVQGRAFPRSHRFSPSEVLEFTTGLHATLNEGVEACLSEVLEARPDLVEEVAQAWSGFLDHHRYITPEDRVNIIVNILVADREIARTALTFMTYAQVGASNDGMGSAGRVLVGVLHDEDGPLIALEPSGIELTPDQGIELAGELLIVAGEVTGENPIYQLLNNGVGGSGGNSQ